MAARTLGGSKGVYAIAAYPETVGAAVMEVENGLHMAAVCTYAADVPPFKDDELLDFMSQVRRQTQPTHGRGCLSRPSCGQAPKASGTCLALSWCAVTLGVFERCATNQRTGCHALPPKQRATKFEALATSLLAVACCHAVCRKLGNLLWLRCWQGLCL